MRLFGLRDVTPASVRQAGPETGILRPFMPSSLPLYAIDLATFDNLNIRSYNYNLSYLRITTVHTPSVSNQYWPVLFTFYYVIQRQRKTKLQEYSKENLEIDNIYR